MKPQFYDSYEQLQLDWLRQYGPISETKKKALIEEARLIRTQSPQFQNKSRLKDIEIILKIRG